MYDKYYYAAQKARTLITQDYDAAYAKVDTILMPASPRTAFKFGEISDPTQMYLSDLYTISLNICGNGGISVPLGLGEDTQLPVSAQLVGPAFKDHQLLTFARAWSAACRYRHGCARAFRRARFCREGRRAVMKELSEVLQDWEAVIGPGDPYRAHRTRYQDVLQLQSSATMTSPTPTCARYALGLPGAPPVPNKRAIESIVKAGLATNCEIQRHSMFYRKALFLSRYGQELPDYAGSGCFLPCTVTWIWT